MSAFATFEAGLPSGVTESATAGVELTLASILGERPARVAVPPDDPAVRTVAGIISFVGELKWSMTVLVPEDTALPLVEKFCGFAIPFESDDMADAMGEVVNVIAGEVTVQLEKRRLRGRMSLPTVLRGQGLQLVANRAAASHRVGYRLSFGDFSVRLLAAGTSIFAKLPGK